MLLADRSHTRMDLSLLADTIFVPSGLKNAVHASRVCPSSVCSSAPVATSQTRKVPSLLAVTIFVLSALSDALFTP